jgi:hypothetical protein
MSAPPCAGLDYRTRNVRFGSLADIGQLIRHVRFAPESRHVQPFNTMSVKCQKRTNSCADDQLWVVDMPASRLITYHNSRAEGSAMRLLDLVRRQKVDVKVAGDVLEVTMPGTDFRIIYERQTKTDS